MSGSHFPTHWLCDRRSCLVSSPRYKMRAGLSEVPSPPNKQRWRCMIGKHPRSEPWGHAVMKCMEEARCWARGGASRGRGPWSTSWSSQWNQSRISLPPGLKYMLVCFRLELWRTEGEPWKGGKEVDHFPVKTVCWCLGAFRRHFGSFHIGSSQGPTLSASAPPCRLISHGSLTYSVLLSISVCLHHLVPPGPHSPLKGIISAHAY